MLQKENRLRKKNDFDNLFKTGKSYKSGCLVLRVAENGMKSSRFAFIVSQKVSKKAVVRNKIRRRLRDIVRKNMSDVKNGQDMAIIALPGSDKATFEDFKKSVEKLIKI